MGHGDATGGAGTAALDALVSAVVDARREVARAQALEARLLAEAVDLAVARMAGRRALRRSTDHDLPLREIAAEFGAAMRLSDRTVQARMGDATTLVERFPAVLAAWETGRVDADHVSAIVDSGAAIADHDARADFERRMLEAAEHESPPRLRALARAVAAALDPDAAGDHRRGNDARRVRVLDLDDGLARLIADLPAPLAYAILDRLTEMGRAVQASDPAEADGTDRGAGDGVGAEPAYEGALVTLTGPSRRGRGKVADPADAESPDAEPPNADAESLESDVDRVDTRTLDQVRADVLADLLLAGTPAAHGPGDALGAIKGHVQVTVPVLTLAGTSREPTLLAGYGPIDPELARRLAAGHPGGIAS